MRFQFHLPRVTSTVETSRDRGQPILDGHDVVISDLWKIPPNTVALVGRPAVWFALDFDLPRIQLGFTTLEPRQVRWEQDFGGHLLIAITGTDPRKVSIIESGPVNPNGTGALVPFEYPEDDFAKRGIIDFEPVVIEPPHGVAEDFFANLVRATQRAYDGNQRYTVIEIPFLRIGRDSNSYVAGIALACGIDGRILPKPQKNVRFEWFGYPGVEDPVHRANFGTYMGAPTELHDGVLDVAYHDEDGSVRLVLVGGEPNGRARLPDGVEVGLDALGRIAFSPNDARSHGLPSVHTEPPENIRHRRRFPADPAPAGAYITIVVDGRSVPLKPGSKYRGTIVARNDALGIASMRTSEGQRIALPITELGVELRDPKRVDKLFAVGNELSVGLHRDRHPQLQAHGAANLKDRLQWRQLHAPRPVNIAGTAAFAAVALAGVLVWWRWR